MQEQAIQGSGLGLPIVKTIVESHEGQIEVQSEEGVGTTFRIILPRVEAEVWLLTDTDTPLRNASCR